MPPAPLPAAPNMEHLKKQAKDLLAACRANNSAALARTRTHLPAIFHAAHDTGMSLLRLSHAQLVIAREYGFASWPRLKRHVSQMAAANPSETAGIEGVTWETLLRDNPALAGLSPITAASARAIRTAHWTETRTRWDDKDGEDICAVMQEWIRVSPPAHAWRNDRSDGWSHDVIDARGHFHTASTWKTCSLRPHSSPFLTTEVLKKVLFLPDEVDNNAQPPGDKRKEWKRETVQQGRHTLIHWQHETIQGNFHVTEAVWTERDTPRIVRQERRETNLLNQKPASLTVCDRYIYNAEPPTGTFHMPPDKPVETRTYKDTMPEVWETFTQQEQRAIKTLLARSDAAWQNGDFGVFASHWQFQFTTDLPDETTWKARVEQQAGIWSHWHSEVESANTQDFVPVRIDTHSCTFRLSKRKVLRAKVKLQVTWDGAERPWEGKAEFYLRREGRRYHIVHWECPWEEIKAAHEKGELARLASDWHPLQ